MDQPAAWGLVRWLARKAGVDVGELNPHSLRHRFVTAALTPAFRCETCKTPPDTPPRTTRRCDRARHNLDRAVTTP